MTGDLFKIPVIISFGNNNKRLHLNIKKYNITFKGASSKSLTATSLNLNKIFSLFPCRFMDRICSEYVSNVD